MSTLLLVVGAVVGIVYIFHHVVVKGKRCTSKKRLDGKTVIVTAYGNLQEGDVMLLKDSQVAPNEWPMAVITSAFPKGDGRVRMVEIKTTDLIASIERSDIPITRVSHFSSQGSNAGIGKTTAIDLAKRGARVILACRSKERGEAALEEIKRESGSNQVVFMPLDLGSLKSVRSFAETFLKSEPRLDILINNAGIYLQGRTEDGLGMMFGVNHIGHFLLTNLLLDRLKDCEPSRVVIVSSMAHSFGKIDFDCLNTHKSLGLGTSFSEVFQVYSHSKLCNVLFTHELAKRLQGTKVTCYCLHPGAINTELARNTSSVMQMILKPVTAFFFKNTVQGAQTTLHCAVEEGIEPLTGRYFSNCSVREVYAKAKDDAAAKKLWELSERLSGLA